MGRELRMPPSVAADKQLNITEYRATNSAAIISEEQWFTWCKTDLVAESEYKLEQVCHQDRALGDIRNCHSLPFVNTL